MSPRQYERARQSTASLASLTSSLASIPEAMEHDDTPLPPHRRPSWARGDDAFWTVQDITRATCLITPDAPETKPGPKRKRRFARARPSSQTFTGIIGGLFQSPFTANNPEGVEAAVAAQDGPYPRLSGSRKAEKKLKRFSWT